MSYLDAGYNEYLENPISIPGGQSAIDVEALLQSGSVKATELLGNINADQISGGTLKLSGDDNFSFLDENNEEIVKISKDGLSVTNGKINIKDENNNILINNDGLYSEIITGTKTFSGSKSITGDSVLNYIPNLSDIFTLKRESFCTFIANIPYIAGGTSINVVFGFIIDGKKYPPTGSGGTTAGMGGQIFYPSTNYTQAVVNYYMDLKAGNHSIQVVGARSSTDSTLTVDALNGGRAYLSYTCIPKNI